MFRPSGPHQLTPYCYAQMECAVEQLSDKVTSKRGENYHLTVLLRIPSAHNNMASTDEDRKVETCFITV